MADVVIGTFCKLYYNKTSDYGGTGTYASPEWVEIKCRSVNVALEKTEIDISERGVNWKASKGGMKSAGCDIEAYWKNGDAGFTALKDSYLDDTSIELLALTGDIDASAGGTGSEGPRMTCDVFNFSRNEGMDEAVTATVNAKPNGTRDVEWYEV